ncbi:hypothetical protein F2Q69_00058664 [Brassica cretica]|uniref:Uncharacterized protein n=1 Tax=Brassica cretica TaxID=69181 RepID=A0A8S9RMJ8_BRACR|nr:hypothetical protein F2Q69_00058664 [Brassica cretica]
MTKKKRNGRDESSKFAPSRGVLLVARGNLPRVYYPSFCFLPPCGFPTFLLSLCGLHSLKLNFPFSGGRVRSKKQRSGVGPSESIDFSGSSLDLTVEVENLICEVIDLAPPSAEVGEFPPVGPLSSTGVDEVTNWRAKYHLYDDVVIRIPGPIDRVSDFEVDEVPVYEGVFESGFRDRVPSLVAKVLEALKISLAHLNPPSWRTLIALQNLGDLEGLTIWVAEKIAKKNRKRVPAFDGRWTEKFAFMYFSGFSTVWCTAEIPGMDPSLGEKTITQVLELPIERRQRRASGNMSGSKGEEALAEYKRALEVMSAKKAAPKKAAPSENDDEVQFIKSNKRQATTALASSSKKRSRASGSTLRVSPSSSNNPATVLANLNTKVFSSTPVILPERDSSASVQLIQGDLLQAMTQLFRLGERMDEQASLKAALAELTFQLREEKNNVLAKEKEIKALKLKVRNQDEAGALAAAENVSLRERLEQREEEEWLNHQTESWDLEGALEQYKMVKTSEAEFQGLPSPTFEGEPSIPSGTETEKTPEPVADDPPAS